MRASVLASPATGAKFDPFPFSLGERMVRAPLNAEYLTACQQKLDRATDTSGTKPERTERDYTGATSDKLMRVPS
jgi:hypothetical protein